MVLSKDVEMIIMDMTGCDEQEASDMWQESKVGQLVNRYIDKKVEDKYGENMSYGSASGGVELNFEIDEIVNYEKDIYYDLKGNEIKKPHPLWLK